MIFFFSVSFKPFYLQELLFVLKMYLKCFKTSLLAMGLYAIVKCIYRYNEFLKQSFKVKTLYTWYLFLFRQKPGVMWERWMSCRLLLTPPNQKCAPGNRWGVEWLFCNQHCWKCPCRAELLYVRDRCSSRWERRQHFTVEVHVCVQTAPPCGKILKRTLPELKKHPITSQVEDRILYMGYTILYNLMISQL